MNLVSRNLTNLVPLEELFYIEWYKVNVIGGDELHRPPVVALNGQMTYLTGVRTDPRL